MSVIHRACVFMPLLILLASLGRLSAGDNEPPKGFTALFNGKDLTGWKVVGGKPGHWTVEEGVLVYDGKANHLATERDYSNCVLHLDWKLAKGGDSGVFFRGQSRPQDQIQIWNHGTGSGGIGVLQINPKVKADNPIGEWNHFEITVEKGLVSVALNGKLVVDKHDMKFMKAAGPIMLQHHATPLWFKNIYIKELPE